MSEDIEKEVDKQPKNNLGGATGKGFMPGVSGNPEGRPKGKTLKEFAREYYMLKTDEEKKEYIEKMEEKIPGFAWKMAEGNPHQTADIKADLNITVDSEQKKVIEDAVDEVL